MNKLSNLRTWLES